MIVKMKKGLKSLIISGIVFTLFFSSIFCCCLTENVHAEEQIPACHQTSQETNEPHDSDDCACRQAFTVPVYQKIEVSPWTQDVFQMAYDLKKETLSILQYSVAYQAPPKIVTDTFPIYLRNSNLRL